MSNPTISVYIPTQGAKQTLRLEAAKRDLSLSKYCGLLLEKVTNRFTFFPNPDVIPTRITHDEAKPFATMTVHIYLGAWDIKHALEYSAEKYGLTLSKYCTYLLTLATNGFTEFDIPDHPKVQVLSRKQNNNESGKIE